MMKPNEPILPSPVAGEIIVTNKDTGEKTKFDSDDFDWETVDGKSPTKDRIHQGRVNDNILGEIEIEIWELSAGDETKRIGPTSVDGHTIEDYLKLPRESSEKSENLRLNIIAKAVDYLRQNSEKRYTAREIAEWIFSNFPDECREKQERSSVINNEADLLQQIVREISSQIVRIQERNSKIKITEGRPRKFYYTISTDSEEIELAESDQENRELAMKLSIPKEHDLYPKLTEYLNDQRVRVYNKRIDEKRSRNTSGPKGNKWLHPDLVGLQAFDRNWHTEVKQFAKLHGDPTIKLWSFEVKPKINRSNVREAFFQTVSNSSWANFGYLVASEIENAEEELGILSNLHGIGFILIDFDTPIESQMLFPARERNQIDWNTVNRIAQENMDFHDYIMKIREYYQSGNIHDAYWD